MGVDRRGDSMTAPKKDVNLHREGFDEYWKYNERSTRNCFNAKVQGTNVVCSKGVSLGVGTIATPLARVLRKGVSCSRECSVCLLFVHDTE